MPYNHGKFGPSAPKGTPSMGKPIDAKPGTSEHEQKHGKPQAPHGGNQEKHVTETHPGKTQPHPETGVHAVHAHHTGSHSGGGEAYTTHTHHDDGTVESRENRSHDEMMQDHAEAFPQSGGNEMPNEPMGEDRDQYADMMTGIGGNEGQSV